MAVVTECIACGRKRVRVCFEREEALPLYLSEARRYHLEAGAQIEDETYRKLRDEVVTLRAKKRAMHLLEKMERTEWQLREKLRQGGYPQCCIDAALDYVKSFHYVDDYRYACMYVRSYREKISRLAMKRKLLQKGVSAELIQRALEEEYHSDESEQISRLLEKRHFTADTADEGEFRRTYQYLLRRGFSGGEVLRVMRTLA